MFVVGRRYHVGYQKDVTEPEVRRLIEAEREGSAVELTIPERAKPGLFRRMRSIAPPPAFRRPSLVSLPSPFVVNLIELGCTLGLPAVYTRILSLRDLSPGARYAYLALYNAVYVVPLAVIVIVYALTMHRLALTERGAKLLKGISGGLLVASGLVFVLRPELLY